MFEYGTKPSFNYTEYPVDKGYTFAKGEWGRMENGVFDCQQLWIGMLPSVEDEKNIGLAFIKTLQSKGAVVKYLRCHVDSEVEREVEGVSWYHVKLYIEECIFQGDPFIIDDALLITLVIIAVTAGLTFYFMWAYSPIIYKWANVEPKKVQQYQLAQATPMVLFIFLILAVAVVIFAYKGGKVKR